MLAAGFVLVGGDSSRMGQDKARLPWYSRSLVEYVAAEVLAAVGNVALVGAPERYRDLGLELLPDLRLGCGPLAGIEAALATGRGEWNLIVACDMPGLTQSTITPLLEEARLGRSADCVAARDSDGRLQPLCAVYRNTCLATVRQGLEAGQLKLHRLLENLHTTPVEVGHQIWNVNTPEEWKEWRLKKHIRTT